MEWIAKDDILPEFGKGVLIHLNTGLITIGYRSKKVSKGYSQEYAWQLFGDMEITLWVSEDDYVTHWMQLPEPPKQK